MFAARALWRAISHVLGHEEEARLTNVRAVVICLQKFNCAQSLHEVELERELVGAHLLVLLSIRQVECV